MKRRIKIDKDTGLAYIAKDIRDDGYVGDVEALANALTITLMRPKAKLKDIHRSLQIVLQDVELRMEQEGEEAPVEVINKE